MNSEDKGTIASGIGCVLMILMQPVGFYYAWKVAFRIIEKIDGLVDLIAWLVIFCVAGEIFVILWTMAFMLPTFLGVIIYTSIFGKKE